MSLKSIRQCELVTQIESDEDVKHIEEVIKKHSVIKKWSYIIHDKDEIEDDVVVDEDKDKTIKYKPKHIHLLMKFNTVQKLECVAKWFGVEPNFISTIKGNWNDANKYLIHSNAEEKHQYSPSEVVSNYDYKFLIQQLNEDYHDLIEKILEGELTRSDIGNKINFFTYSKHKKMFDDAFQVSDRTYLREHKNDELTVFYICGSSNTGKTTLAQLLAKELTHDSPCISSSSNDPLENYQGEKSFILDDLRPKVFEISDLLKMLDPHLRTSTKSRYFNKVLRCKYIFITTVVEIDDFFKGSYCINDEPITQLKRRCKYYIKIDNREIFVYVWDDETNQYYLKVRRKNKIIEKIKKEKRINSVIDFIEDSNFVRDLINKTTNINKEQ